QVYGAGAAASNITVRGITFDGNQTGITALPSWANTPSSAPLSLLNVTNLIVDACQVINAIGYSLLLYSPVEFTVTNCRVLSGQVSAAQGWGTPNQQDGIHVSGPASNGMISGNFVDTGTANGVGDDGIALEPYGDIHEVFITGNSVRSAAACIDLAIQGGNIYNVVIADNNLWGSLGSGIVCQPFSTGTYVAYDVAISGNTISNPAGAGAGGFIQLLDYTAVSSSGSCWHGFTITGNMFSSCTQSGAISLYALSGYDLTVACNTFY